MCPPDKAGQELRAAGQKAENWSRHWVPWPAPRARLLGERNPHVFPVQNDKSSTPGLKSNTPTPRNDAPTPGTSTTPGLRSMPGKPPGMDPIGIMGRHNGAGSTAFEGRGPPRGRGWSPTDGQERGEYVGVGALAGIPGGFRVKSEEVTDAGCVSTDGRAYWELLGSASDRSGYLWSVPTSVISSVRHSTNVSGPPCPAL